MTDTLDLRTMTADDAITAMMTVAGLRAAAGSLNAGDKIVWHDDDGYHVDTVKSVLPSSDFGPDGVTVSTAYGYAWSCSPRNTRCLRIPSWEEDLPCAECGQIPCAENLRS